MAIEVSKQAIQNIETEPSTVRFGLVLVAARMLGVSVVATPTTHRERVLRLLSDEIGRLE